MVNIGHCPKFLEYALKATVYLSRTEEPTLVKFLEFKVSRLA